MGRKIACMALAAILGLLCACTAQPPSGSGTVLDPPSVPLQQPQNPLTGDENLLKMRGLLLDEAMTFGITIMGRPEDGTYIRIEPELLLHIADELTRNEPARVGGWVDYQPESDVQINIQCSGDEVLYFGIGTLDGDTALLMQMGDGSDEDTITASYLYNDHCTIFDAIRGSVEKRRTPQTAQITGSYISFALGPNEVDCGMLQIGGTFVVLATDEEYLYTDASPKAYTLYYIDTGTLKTTWHTTFEDSGSYLTLEACAWQGYDFRILRNNGSYTYYDVDDPDNTLERALPDQLSSLVNAVLDAGRSPFDASWDADDAHDAYAATDGETLLLNTGGQMLTFTSSEIPTDEIEGFDASAATIRYISVRLLNGGRSMVAYLEMPGGPQGQGQNITAGLLVYDIPTGQRHWLYNVYPYGYGRFGVHYSPDGKTILGLLQTGEETLPSRPVALNLDTLEVTRITGIPHNTLDDNWNETFVTTQDFETYLIQVVQPQTDGQYKTTASYVRGGVEQPLCTAVAPQLVFWGGTITKDFVIFPVREAAGTWYAVMPII